MHNLLKQK